MHLLQRRIFLECAKVFALALSVLLVFILMGRALQLRDMLFGLDLGPVGTLRLIGYLSPLFLLMICPVACMLAVFLTFLRMGTSRELVALRAGGVSLYQLLAAPLLFSVLCLGLGLWLSLYWQAWGLGHFRAEVLGMAGSGAKVAIRPGVFNKDIPGMVFFARQVDPEEGTLSRVLVEDSTRSDGALTILAPEGSLGTDYARGELLFLLKNGRIYAERGQTVSVLGFDEYIVRLPVAALFKGLDLGPIKANEMAWDVLAAADVAQLLEENPRMANKIVVERHKRFVFPVACVVLALFVIPIAASAQGLRRQSGLALALALFLVYYSILSVGVSLGESGQVSPLVGLWLPNIVFLALGLWGISLAANERMPRLSGHVERALRRWKRRRAAAKDDHADGGGL